MAFDDPKTELLHFHRRRHSPQCTVTHPNGVIIKASTVIRWLGVFFDRKLSFKAYVDKKSASPSRALQMASRLKTSEWGLSSQHFRQLYTTCVLPIIDFGVEAWFRGQKGYMIDKLQILQNTASRRILEAFRISPIMPMVLEASLPPTAIRLQQTCRKYALRTMTLPEYHPIQQRTSTTFPPKFGLGIEIDIQHQDWDTTNSKHSQLCKIHNTIATLSPSTTYLERFDHTTNPPGFQPLDEDRVSICIPQPKKDDVAETHTN